MKELNDMTLGERLVFELHNNNLFGCDNHTLKHPGTFHTCPNCIRKAKAILMFLQFECSEERQNL